MYCNEFCYFLFIHVYLRLVKKKKILKLEKKIIIHLFPVETFISYTERQRTNGFELPKIYLVLFR